MKYNLMEQIGQEPKKGLAMKQAFFTKKADALYAIIPGWPPEPMVLRDVSLSPGSVVSMLGVPGELKHELNDNDLIIHRPDLGTEEAPCRYAYVFKITGARLRH